MGYTDSLPAVGTLAARYRHLFPVTERVLYLNHAGVAPLSQPAADAMRLLNEDALRFGSLHYDQWLAGYEGLRQAAARLINAHRDEIAIVKNTSEGILTVALGLEWRAGDVVVAFKEEFPANYYCWRQLADRGVEVRWLSYLDPLERIDAACRGAKLLALSYVQYLSGYRADLVAVGEICRRHGTFFFVDAIQGLGAFPLDVRAANIQALAADGHKWLLGPEGCGLLYVQQEWQDRIHPVMFGWTNVASFNDYASRDETLRPDAGRYEPGTLNTVGCFGLRASLELILEIGVEHIGHEVTALADRVYDGVRQRGYEVLGERTPAHAAGIVTFRHPAKDCRVVVRELKEQAILAAPRQGWVRVSPHFYQTADDMDRLLAAL